MHRSRCSDPRCEFFVASADLDEFCPNYNDNKDKKAIYLFRINRKQVEIEGHLQRIESNIVGLCTLINDHISQKPKDD